MSNIIAPQPGKQQLAMETEVDVMFFGGARGAGKAMRLDDVVLTPFGFRKNSELKVGSAITNPDGSVCKVIQLHDVCTKDVYRVSFTDGGYVDTNLEHLWNAWRAGRGRKVKGNRVFGEDSTQVVDTKTLLEWLSVAKRQKGEGLDTKNYPLLPVTKEVPFNVSYRTVRRDIAPYLLGLLLGDGCITSEKSLGITSIDNQIITYVQDHFGKDVKVTPKQGTDAVNLAIRGESRLRLIEKLKGHNLLGTYSHTKFIPEVFKYGSISERYEILQGLMDTDGTADIDGRSSFTTTSKKLSEDFLFVLRSLGGVGTITDRIPFYRDSAGEKVYGKRAYTIYIKHRTVSKLFRLERKKERAKLRDGESVFRRVINIEKIEEDVLMRCITVSHINGLYIQGKDWTVTHNSRLLLMKPLYYAHNDPDFHGVFFRRQTDNFTGAGGLWPEGIELYRPFKPKIKIKPLLWEFPIGSTIRCKHMEHEQSKESHRGLQYSFIGWDELDQFTETQFTFLLASLRSRAKCNSFTVATMNPNPDSWILDWIMWYLDDDGQPREDRCGKIRYFVVIGNKPKFADSEEEIAEKYPDAVWVYNPTDDEKVYVGPKTFTFINGTIFDNPALIKANPGYLAELNNLPEIEKKRNLFGNWFARPQGASFFERGWLKEATAFPVGATCCRAWDKAYTEPNEKNRYPDYTACIKMYKDSRGYFYLAGEYCGTCRDDGSDEYGRFRKRFGDRNNKMLEQAIFDGEDCLIAIPSEAGAGKGEYEELVKLFNDEGFIVKGMKTGNAKGAKIERFAPFAAAAQNGLVYILRDTFNKATYDYIMKELEGVDGTPSTGKKKDDMFDAVADVFLALQKTKVHKAVHLPSIAAGNTTLLSAHRKRIR